MPHWKSSCCQGLLGHRIAGMSIAGHCCMSRHGRTRKERCVAICGQHIVQTAPARCCGNIEQLVRHLVAHNTGRRQGWGAGLGGRHTTTAVGCNSSDRVCNATQHNMDPGHTAYTRSCAPNARMQAGCMLLSGDKHTGTPVNFVVCSAWRTCTVLSKLLCINQAHRTRQNTLQI
jgi:hypothetical protein